MKVHDYQAIKYIQTLMLDPEYISHDSQLLEMNRPQDLWRWKRIAIIRQVRANFPYYLKDAKDLVDDVITTVVYDERLLQKFKA